MPKGLSKRTFFVVGDCNSCFAADGQWEDNFLEIVSRKHNVVFRNISGAGLSLGGEGVFGVNSQSLIDVFDAMAGLWIYTRGVIVAAGTNDYSGNIPVARTEESLTRIMAWARAKKQTKQTFQALVFEPTWRAGEERPNELELTLSDYRAAMRAVCDNFSDVAHWVDAPKEFFGSATLYAVDEAEENTQLHWNVAGHQLMAAKLEAAAHERGMF